MPLEFWDTGRLNRLQASVDRLQETLERMGKEQRQMSTTITQLATDFAAFQTAFGTFATDFAAFVTNTQAALAALANAGENLTPTDQASITAIDSGLDTFAANVATMDAAVKGVVFPVSPAPPAPAPQVKHPSSMA
jgi:ABC-type transporter Mla subunit MlaD